jgi:LPXTG-motif cell wall-anchored protein
MPVFSTSRMFAGANNSYIVGTTQTTATETAPGNFANILSRYLANDSLDLTWGTSGQLRIDVNPAIPESGEINEMLSNSLTFPDGSLIFYIMAEKSGMYPVPTTNESQHLVKVGASGSLDNTFGTSGIKDITNAAIDSQNLKIDSMTPGAAGPSGTFFFQARLGSNSTPGIVKFTAAGAFDTSFGQGGFVSVPYPNDFEMNGTTFDADADGNLYVGTATSNTGDAVVAKFSANGVAVQSFGTNGVLTLNTSSDPVEYVSQIDFNDGKLSASIVSGGAGWEGVKKITTVVRFNTNGVLDASFGVGGRATITGSSKMGMGTLSSFWALPDGGMWVVSPGDFMPQSPVTFAKLSPDGTSLTSWFSVKLGACDNTNYRQDAVVTASGVYLLAGNSDNVMSEDMVQVLNIFKIGLTETSPTTTTTTVPATTTTTPAVTTTIPAAATTTVPPPALAIVQALPVAPTPIVADATISRGEEITVSFGGFTPFEFVQLIVASTPQVIGSGYANAQGVVTLSGNLPSTLASGNHTLAVFAPVSGIGFTQPITVSQPLLPATGSDGQNNLYVIAMLLFVLGLIVRRTSTVITNK